MKRILPAILALLLVSWWSVGQFIPPPSGGGTGSGDMTKAVYDSDDDGVIDAGALPAGSGSMTTVKEATAQVGGADIVSLDFGAGFDLTESPDTEINVALDLSEVATGGDLTWVGNAPSLGADVVDDTHIDWGSGANQVDGADVPFADPDSNFGSNNLSGAIAELDDVNPSGVNAGDGKVEWTQLAGVPEDFADGVDDEGGSADFTGLMDGGGTGVATNWAAIYTDELNPTTINAGTLNSTTQTIGSATVTNNIGAIMAAPVSTNVIDMAFASRFVTLNAALTILHATNAVASTELTHVLYLRAGGADRALTIPATWQTNTYSPKPASITNGYLTKIFVTTIGATADAASQTNALVSFEYYKVP